MRKINLNKKSLIALLALSYLFVSVGAVSAEVRDPVSGNLPSDEPDTVIARIFSTVAWIIASVAALMIVIGGIMWMTAGGDDEQTTRARKLIIAAVVGLIIIGAAVGIAQFVLSVFNR